MGRRGKAGFWSGWVGALGLTGVLLLWHLPFAPFSTPGARANEAAAVFLLAMALRWAILAGLVAFAARRWARRLGLRGLAGAGLAIGTLALHLLLGLLNLGIWDAWLSAGREHTPQGDTLLAAAYFLIPSLALAALACAAWPLLHGKGCRPGPAGDRGRDTDAPDRDRS